MRSVCHVAAQICPRHDAAMYHLMYVVRLHIYVSHLLRPRSVSGADSMCLSHQLSLDDVTQSDLFFTTAGLLHESSPH